VVKFHVLVQRVVRPVLYMLLTLCSTTFVLLFGCTVLLYIAAMIHTDSRLFASK